jgi:hypothetical protein
MDAAPPPAYNAGLLGRQDRIVTQDGKDAIEAMQRRMDRRPEPDAVPRPGEATA